MRKISLEEFDDHPAEMLDPVADEHEVVVSRPGRGDVVLVPLGDYAGLRETVHLRSPANSRPSRRYRAPRASR